MIEFTLELSDSVVMQSKHTISRIFHKNFGNWKTNYQNFNKLYSNRLKEKDEEKKEPINIEATEQKSRPL